MLNFKRKNKGWNKPLILISSTVEMKKNCTTILHKEGTTALENKLEEFRQNLLLVYPETVDLVLLEIFGDEFQLEQSYKIYSTYKLFQSNKNLETWTKHICRCYLGFILFYK